ncbi:MAG: DUF4892 domain-containing protein [Parahaliea sp.]
MTLVFSSAQAVLLLVLLWPACGFAQSAPSQPELLLQSLDEFPHARRIGRFRDQVEDYEVGLGAMRKQFGDWSFKHSRRINGERVRYNWQIVDGYSSSEVFDELANEVESLDGSEVLYTCQGRACGHAAQWANRVFGERLLYGRAEDQRYRIYRIANTGGEGEHYLLVYAGVRSSERQYLHAEVIALTP